MERRCSWSHPVCLTVKWWHSPVNGFHYKCPKQKLLQLSDIYKTKIMASGPITSWQIDGETMETVRDFILGGLQNHCRWWLQFSAVQFGLPWWLRWQRIRCVQCGRPEFDHWVGKMPWRRAVATHSSVLAWRIPRMGEPGGLQSMGLHRVGHDWSDLAAAAAV